jgi:ribonuclease PH
MTRSDSRQFDQLRTYKFTRNYIKTSEGSVLVECGDTKVIVTAKVEANLPPFMRDNQELEGWVTAEYSMLPGSGQQRVSRERNKYNARSLEIQRLIGRSLRAMVDMKKLPGITINIDADVIQADGGTRTASITGAYVAVYDCLKYLQTNPLKIKTPKDIKAYENNPDIKILSNDGKKMEFLAFQTGLPIINQIAAVSVGICNSQVLLDLNYEEDSSAEADGNFILTKEGDIIEIQSTAEKGVISQAQFQEMLNMAKTGVTRICELQDQALL